MFHVTDQSASLYIDNRAIPSVLNNAVSCPGDSTEANSATMRIYRWLMNHVEPDLFRTTDKCWQNVIRLFLEDYCKNYLNTCFRFCFYRPVTGAAGGSRFQSVLGTPAGSRRAEPRCPQKQNLNFIFMKCIERLFFSASRFVYDFWCCIIWLIDSELFQLLIPSFEWPPEKKFSSLIKRSFGLQF